jgi:hypothetical protein
VNPPARALDTAGITADHLIIDGCLEDRMQQPVSLGHRHWPEQPAQASAGIETFLAPPADRGLVYATQSHRAEGWQQVIVQEALV